MKEVVIDGVVYVPKPNAAMITVSIGNVTPVKKEPAKQDIRDYCREHRVWAAKDKDGTWANHSRKPVVDGKMWSNTSFIIGTATRFQDASRFTFPDVPWDKSLIAPNGSMPLWDKQLPTRGDPVFVWNDSDSHKVPPRMAYFYGIENNRVAIYSYAIYGVKAPISWDHYLPFDAALVGVPRKDWPKQ